MAMFLFSEPTLMDVLRPIRCHPRRFRLQPPPVAQQQFMHSDPLIDQLVGRSLTTALINRCLVDNMNNQQNELQQAVQQQVRKEELNKWHCDGKLNELVYRFDVSDFRPAELSIELLDNAVVVRGEHKEQNEGEFVHNRFTRTIVLPDDIVPESICCALEKVANVRRRHDEASDAFPARALSLLCSVRGAKRQQKQDAGKGEKEEEAAATKAYTIPVKVVSNEQKKH